VLEVLTGRELDVFRLVASGLTNAKKSLNAVAQVGLWEQARDVRLNRSSAVGDAVPMRSPQGQDQDLRMPSCRRLRPRRRTASAMSVSRQGSRDRERRRRKDRTEKGTDRGIAASAKYRFGELVSRARPFRSLLVLAALAMFSSTGCGRGTGQNADIARAEHFASFPLYWVGPRFEQWNLTTIQGLKGPREFVSLIYGTCTPRGGEQPSCTPPFEIQIFPLCWHLDVVASAPLWKRRRVRGAPLGRNPDGAPVLFTRRIQVKVYRGEGSDAGLPLRVLRALRSINHVPPVINPEDTIPPPRLRVLEGSRPCRR
jgi:hypothetical protein